MCLLGLRVPNIAAAQLEGDEPLVGSAENPFMPMEVLGDMSEDGLGLVQWWSSGEAAEGEDGEARIGVSSM